jgi:hypothetical protein
MRGTAVVQHPRQVRPFEDGEEVVNGVGAVVAAQMTAPAVDAEDQLAELLPAPPAGGVP